ncbi:hypothetical protein WJX72_000517 [[Myrmecia] bisecta]|uniref:Peptidase M48 domain-containing protein n=1 Tax=[Myrmecia] bisecta TaxID=41462 RepID=A0AAW1QNQ9_9CHLO
MQASLGITRTSLAAFHSFQRNPRHVHLRCPHHLQKVPNAPGFSRGKLACRAKVKDRDAVVVSTNKEGGSIVQQITGPLSGLAWTAIPVAIGGGLGALGYGQEGVALGAAVGAAARGAQLLFLQQSVPFTGRKHTLLLPVGVELSMGERIFQQQLRELESSGKVLPSSASDYKLIHKISERVINAVETGRGGGFQSHISKFHWEVVVIEDKTPNAFVLPGGKIVVMTGLIKLMERDEDLLAAVIGHEVAHALARHSTEKMTLGLAITVGVNIAFAAIQFYMQRQQQQNGGQGGRGSPQQGRGYSQRGIPVSYGGPYSSAYGVRRGVPPGYGRGGFGGGRSPLLNPQLISIFTNIFLQMPFSRRAEAEADLIGMKLMALAGYNANKAPETFRRLASMETQKMGGVAGSNTARMVTQINCTHPRSENRVKMLEEELENMRQHGDVALDRVMHDIPYWML